MLPSGSAGEVDYIQSFFQQQFQGIYISGWKAAVVRPSYPDLLNIFCVRHVSWTECCLLIIISSALHLPHTTKPHFCPCRDGFLHLKARKPASISSAAVLVYSGDFSLPNIPVHTHDAGRICDSAGGSCVTAVISWVQEERGNWQPADLCSYY